MAENVDPDMPPTLSAIFRRRESALQDDIQRATNTTLYRKSIVDTFYPPEKAPSDSLPIVIQGIRKPGAPTPPPRLSSLEEPKVDHLPPPPAELLVEDDETKQVEELPSLPAEHLTEDDLPLPPAQLLEDDLTEDELPLPPAHLLKDNLTEDELHMHPAHLSKDESTKDDLPLPPAHLLQDDDDLPLPPSQEDLEEEQRYINESYFESYGQQNDRKVDERLIEDHVNSIYEQIQGQEVTPTIGYGLPNSGVSTLPPAMAKRKPGKTKKFAELQEEGKNAIDSPGSPTAPDLPPDDYILEEFEERSMIEPSSYDDRKLRELINVLIDWINDELASQRIIVKDIEEDLFDGQILQKLLEKLSGVKLDVVEVTQSEELQKQKLQTVLDAVNKVLGLPRWNQNKWSVENIHSKNVVSIIHLLVSLVRHFRAPIRLPENVSVNVVVVQKKDGRLQTRTVVEELTSTYDDLGMRVERDAFDTLFDHAPDKLQVVKQSLVTFVNKHLNRINLDVNDLDNQFHDGVYLTLLMGLLEGYFVPLYSFQLTPTNFEQKVANVALAFELMMEAGLGKPKARPEDLVNLDLKSTLRVLYNLFTKYKGIV